MQRRLWFLVLIALAATPVWAAPIDVGNARRVSLDADWRFLKGDAGGAEQPGFDDHAWRALDLPHDWAIEGPFDPSTRSAHRRAAVSPARAGTASTSRSPAACKGRRLHASSSTAPCRTRASG